VTFEVSLENVAYLSFWLLRKILIQLSSRERVRPWHKIIRNDWKG